MPRVDLLEDAAAVNTCNCTTWITLHMTRVCVKNLYFMMMMLRPTQSQEYWELFISGSRVNFEQVTTVALGNPNFGCGIITNHFK